VTNGYRDYVRYRGNSSPAERVDERFRPPYGTKRKRTGRTSTTKLVTRMRGKWGGWGSKTKKLATDHKPKKTHRATRSDTPAKIGA